MNTKEMYDALTDMLLLFDKWKEGIFHTMGVTWVEEPPAILRAREAIANADAARCTGDSFTCPVGHDHP